MTDERGWDEIAPTELYAAERNLDATYLIRIYSVFERAVGSYWRQLPGNEDRQVDGDVLLDEAGRDLVPLSEVAAAQSVRNHRNNLVHRRIEHHAESLTLESASDDLLRFLAALPPTWD